MRNFKNFSVWQKSMLLVKKVYLLAKCLPDNEKFGLYSQITRSAISIPSNIAEGCGRQTDKEFKRFVEISLGSAYELETQLLLIKELEIIKDDCNEVLDLNIEIQKMLQSLIKKLA